MLHQRANRFRVLGRGRSGSITSVCRLRSSPSHLCAGTGKLRRNRVLQQ
jgi:hypothetical protein